MRVIRERINEYETYLRVLPQVTLKPEAPLVLARRTVEECIELLGDSYCCSPARQPLITKLEVPNGKTA